MTPQDALQDNVTPLGSGTNVDDAIASSERASGPDSESAPTASRRGYRLGEILGSKYRIDRVIGEGAMGVVLAATHLGLDETVAIKFIRADMLDAGGTRSRFAREAKIAARIRNEHVVKLLDVGESDSIGPYIVMEYLEGRGLGQVGDRRGRIPLGRAVNYIMQACEALAAAHRIGVTHRDIKPDNLFLTLQGSLEVIKLLDFGISKASLTGHVFGDDLALTKTAHAVGTPMYMSPEQIRSAKEVDHRTDIWSIGAVLYELVTGHTAFHAESVTEICANILEHPAPQVREHCPEAPESLQLLLERCLAKDPDERFQTVAELAEALSPLAPSYARTSAQRSYSILTKSNLNLDAYLTAAVPVEDHTRASRASSDAESTHPAISPQPSRKPTFVALAGLSLLLVAALTWTFRSSHEQVKTSASLVLPVEASSTKAAPRQGPIQPVSLGAQPEQVAGAKQQLTPRDTASQTTAASGSAPRARASRSPSSATSRHARRKRARPSRKSDSSRHSRSASRGSARLTARRSEALPPTSLTQPAETEIGAATAPLTEPARHIRLVTDIDTAR